MKEHPAKFSDPVVEVIGEILLKESLRIHRWPVVVDPFAGVGKIEEAWPKTVGLELEWEWAEQGGTMIQGDALMLPFAPRSIEVFATSPTWGNRFADHHNAKDGSERMSYRHKLGRMPSEGSSAIMQWGISYREFHIAAWYLLHKALQNEGLFILNIGDHIRKHKRVKVAAWHRRTILALGFKEERRIKVVTPKMKKGANRDARVPYEWVLVYRKVA